MSRKDAERRVARYAAALLAVGLTLLVCWVANPWLGTRHVLAGLIAPVAAAVWYGGTGPGMVAFLAGLFGASIVFLFPPLSGPAQAFALLDLIFYAVPCLIIVAFGHSMRARERSLERHALEASRADRRKTEFLALLSHELRSPLAPVVTDLHLIQMTAPTGLVLAATRRMKRQISRMARLVDDLLDISSIERGKIKLHCQRVDLAAIVNACAEAAASRIDAMNNNLTVDVPGRAVYADADGAHIAQVISNLIDNACKFGNTGCQIEVSLRVTGENAAIRVRDAGLGIAPEKLRDMSDMFNHPAEDIERPAAGLGLGLSLALRLVELHGGRLEAASEGLGRGAEFTVYLPLPADQHGASLCARDIAVADQSSVPHRVLIADDDRDAADSLAALLGMDGHRTDVVYSGSECLAEIEKFRPSVLLLDLSLPGASGYEVAKLVRKSAWGKSIALIAITGSGGARDKHKAFAAGFDAHLTKPVDLPALRRLLAPHAAGPSDGARTSFRAIRR